MTDHTLHFRASVDDSWTIIENRRRWAAALRSGDYEQGTEYLHRAGRHTALGVAAALFGEPLDPDQKVPFGAVVDHFGLADKTGPTALLDGDGKNLTLVQLNDEHGLTFDEIAALIDEGKVLIGTGLDPTEAAAVNP